jgi:release factor glutamine methyltransferase
LSIKEFLFEYFAKNVLTLEKDYPGIQFQRFLDEYCTFDHSKPDDPLFMENPGFLEKIKLGIPLEYINFSSFFYKEEFYVNQDVLIPRSETEILCEKAIDIINKKYHEDFAIYDIGTGSGIIPLTIATEIKKKLKITGCDISRDALEVANINYDNLFSKIDNKTIIQFEIRDRMSGIEEKFDLITSNPPYIKEKADHRNVHHQADSYEPHLALYLKDDEYDLWFEDLFRQVSSCLKPGGSFIMEGHEDHLERQREASLNFFKEVEVIKDYTQRDRFLVGKGN